MLINLSNHPLEKWSREQREAAEREYGPVLDLPFPMQDPSASSQVVASDAHNTACHAQRLLEEQGDGPCNAIHVMGEFTFTYFFVREMERRGIRCIASTTKRRVIENADGSKTNVFQFVRFRPYSEKD